MYAYTSTDWDIAVQEGEPLEQKVARARESQVVGSPVLESVSRESLEHLESFGGGDVPVASLLAKGTNSNNRRIYRGDFRDLVSTTISGVKGFRVNANPLG